MNPDARKISKDAARVAQNSAKQILGQSRLRVWSRDLFWMLASVTFITVILHAIGLRVTVFGMLIGIVVTLGARYAIGQIFRQRR